MSVPRKGRSLEDIFLELFAQHERAGSEFMCRCRGNPKANAEAFADALAHLMLAHGITGVVAASKAGMSKEKA